MALSLASISKEAVVRAPRILLLGPQKIGKTCFATGCSFENGRRVSQGINDPVVLPIRGEEGADGLGVPKFPTLNSYAEVAEAIGVLLNEDHSHRTAVIDSASALYQVLCDHVCAANGVSSINKVGKGFGNGETEVATLMTHITRGLDALRDQRGMTVIVIGHVRVKSFDDPSSDGYDRWEFNIGRRSADLLQNWVDLTLFANSKVVVQKEEQGFGKTKARGLDVTGGARFLYTQQRPWHPGGGREPWGQLPYEMPLDHAVFQEALAEIVTNTTTNNEKE